MNPVHAVLLVDRSGSMQTIAADVEGGIQSFIEDQKTGEGKCLLTLVEFDGHNPFHVVYDSVDITEIEPTDYKFKPRGSTPLLDAMGMTFAKLKEREKIRLAASAEPEDYIMVVFTDGAENASQEYRLETIKQLVEQNQEAGWVFMFMAANIDAFATGASMGFRLQNTSGFLGNDSLIKGMQTVNSVLGAHRAASPERRKKAAADAYAAYDVENPGDVKQESTQ